MCTGIRKHVDEVTYLRQSGIMSSNYCAAVETCGQLDACRRRNANIALWAVSSINGVVQRVDECGRSKWRPLMHTPFDRLQVNKRLNSATRRPSLRGKV